MKQTVKTHNYEYSKEASDPTRIVTICSCCGDSKITLIRLSQRVPLPRTLRLETIKEDEIDQMDLWTKPPKYYMPKVMSTVGGLRPRRFD